MKQAIVTGSTGFIGAAFVNYLAQHGVQVLALGRRAFADIPESRRVMLGNTRYLQIDMSEIARLPEEIKAIGWEVESDCIFFNLAWGGEKSLSDLSVARQMKNVEWSASALETAQQIGCTRFIHVGTMEEAFTEKYLELDFHESSQYNRHVIYSIAKMSAKYTLLVKAGQLGMDFIYVLHSHVMGPYDDKDSFLQVTLKKLILGDDLIFSTGEQYFDVVSIRDCSLGYYLICQMGRPGETYWVGSGDPQRLRDYVERMYRLYPSSKEMLFGQMPYNDIVLDKDVFSIDKLVQDTGYQPVMTYEDAVHELHAHLLTVV